jgi:ribosomal protein L44E
VSWGFKEKVRAYMSVGTVVRIESRAAVGEKEVVMVEQVERQRQDEEEEAEREESDEEEEEEGYSKERHKIVAVATVREMLRFACATCTIRDFFFGFFLFGLFVKQRKINNSDHYYHNFLLCYHPKRTRYGG